MKTRTTLPVTAGALGLAVTLALSACSGGEGAATSNPLPSVQNSTVSMNIEGAVTSFDPAKGSSYQDAVMSWALYDTLVSFDTDGKIIPGIAESWTSTTTQSTFKIKPGIKCSDGAALGPAEIAASLNRFFAPETAAPLASLVLGQGNSATATASGDSVTVNVKNPWNGLLAGLATPFTGIICPSGLSDANALATASHGSGAWVTKSQVTGSSYTLESHKDYNWGPTYKDQPSGKRPDTLVMKVIADESTRANLMETGELQIAGYYGDSFDRFKDRGVKVSTSPQTDTMLVFNETPGKVTADPEVRKAIVQAIDRSQFNNIQSRGSGTVMNNLGQDNYPCYDPSLESSITKTDTAAAAKVLKDKNITIIGTNVLAGGDNNGYVLSALQAAGAKANLQNLDNKAWVGNLFSGKNDWDVTVFPFGNPLNSLVAISGYYAGGTPPNGRNFGSIDNPDVPALLTAAGSSEGEAGCNAMSALQKSLFERNDVVPLATAPVNVVFAGGSEGTVVKGFVQPSSIRIAG